MLLGYAGPRRRDEGCGHQEYARYERQRPRDPIQAVPARRERRERRIHRVRELRREQFALKRTRHETGEEAREYERENCAEDEAPPWRPPIRGERDEQEHKDERGHALPEWGAVVSVLPGVHRERAWRGLGDRPHDHEDGKELRPRLQERADGREREREVREQRSFQRVLASV